MPPKVKKYPHFDSDLTLKEASDLATSPSAVTRHTFFPFIDFTERWTKFAIKGAVGKEKTRPIRYASRRDSCIYSHYREILVSRYESRLAASPIQNSILAYRRISVPGGTGNKCNVHFANDAFSKIEELGDCFVYSLDISKFFDSIDHAKLKSQWCKMLDLPQLPDDHYQVFKSMTRYASVNKDKLYRLLGFVGGKKNAAGHKTFGYLCHKVPLQVCSSQKFRSMVTPLIRVNKKTHGIPQGAPISDVLANIYLLDFDLAMASELAKDGGIYFRYSDDILLIVPGLQDDHVARLARIQDIMNKCGEKLILQPLKSCVHKFEKHNHLQNAPQTCTLMYGTQGRNGLEYLGFRFDGKGVYLRDSTRTGLNRRVVSSAKRMARIHRTKHPSSSMTDLLKTFNYDLLISRFGKVKDFDSKSGEYKSWTFWTYALRSLRILGPKGRPIQRQMRSYKAMVRVKAEKAIADLF